MYFAFARAYVERPEVLVFLAVKHDYEILRAKNTSQECEGAHQFNTTCHNEILRTIYACVY